MDLLERHFGRVSCDSCESFRDHFRTRVPERFVFAHGVARRYSRPCPGDRLKRDLQQHAEVVTVLTRTRA